MWTWHSLTKVNMSWVSETLVGEIAEMEEAGGGKVWTRKCLRWADGELATSLVRAYFISFQVFRRQ